MRGDRGRRGERDQKTVQWTVFRTNARARLRGPGHVKDNRNEALFGSLKEHPDMRFFLALLLSFQVFLEPVVAEVAPSEQTTKLVQDVTSAFFNLLPEDNYQAERAFMTDNFASETPLEAWKSVREKFKSLAGSSPRYSPHRLTYYKEGALLAAVDFSGQGAKSDTFVCGFILWEIPEPNKIGFFRLEQNVVSVPLFNQMPKQQAAQLMADWHCPTPLIEATLNIKLE
jgi:hypothetical protein